MKKKTDEREWAEDLLDRLPEEASDEVVSFARGLEEINPPVILFGRESVPEPHYDIMTCLGWIGKEKYHWGARCRCTSCGDVFDAGYKDNHVVLLQMEDGNLLEGWTSGDEYEDVSFAEGTTMECPRCGQHAILVRRSSIRGSRRCSTQVVELANIGSTTVLIYWIATYYLKKTGYEWGGISPRAAVAISPEGNLFRYSHVGCTMTTEYWIEKWKELKGMRDPEMMPFSSEGPVRRTIGGYYIRTAGDMQGTTGEKTGIAAYFTPEAQKAATYLMLWKRFPNIENLVNTGAKVLTDTLVEKCQKRANYSYASFCFTVPDMEINFREKKPHRMLGVTRPEFKAIASERWSVDDMNAFLEYRSMHPKTRAEEFTEWLKTLGGETLETLRPFWAEGLDKLYKYLCRQEADHGIGVIEHYYYDYRNMLDRLRAMSGIAGALTQVEKFPADLVEAHERVNDAIRAIERERKQRGGSKEQFQTFAELKQKHAALEWKSGEYCIIIPESPEDLVREGETLHHCVGGYASQHCKGQMIFFVRHARRPERSWFTLNENINGENVSRIQLHGYGNEFAHGKRLTIPEKVENFVQEWETTILAPYLKNKSRRITA